MASLFGRGFNPLQLHRDLFSRKRMCLNGHILFLLFSPPRVRGWGDGWNPLLQDKSQVFAGSKSCKCRIKVMYVQGKSLDDRNKNLKGRNKKLESWRDS